ncbi:hypothetical protein llap_13632 [Limosa lapponica baueri]|uniref:Uncharacterized protein n=1 Tax=Limosa lapponica baueri TaxID=1758121 RepID=A0A2I0TQJ8_LIMLA|nr:hypothetical protein llap_13632 [Limosa lapponica baueri]
MGRVVRLACEGTDSCSYRHLFRLSLGCGHVPSACLSRFCASCPAQPLGPSPFLSFSLATDDHKPFFRKFKESKAGQGGVSGAQLGSTAKYALMAQAVLDGSHPAGKDEGRQVLKTLSEELKKRKKKRKWNVLMRQIWKERKRNSEE